MRRIIFHVDVNSAFLSWEAVYRLKHLDGRPDLREIPSAVGGDREKRHGIILAKSIPAKRYHIQTGEPITDAMRKCPDLVIVPPNYNLYSRSSKAMNRILERYTDQIERYSIDESFLDMTHCPGGRKAEETAGEIRAAIEEELGFTVNVGVAENKLLAKMASDFQKPNRVHTLWPEEIPRKMWPLPVRDLLYVGSASEQKLKSLGIRTIGELAAAPPEILKLHLKSHGLLLHRYANGFDPSPVVSDPPPNKGYGNSLTTPRDVTDAGTAKLFLLSLAETLSARIRNDKVKIGVVAVSIRDCDLRFFHHQATLSAATDLTSEIYQAACRCFDELWDRRPIRLLGIHTSRVTADEGRQLGFFDPVDYDKQKQAETAVDKLRRKYGADCIKRACFLEFREDTVQNGRNRNDGETAGGTGMFIDHMGGGISRDKRGADYSRETVL